jgi:hypothetical protein
MTQTLERTEEQTPRVEHTLHITDATGDTRHMWDPAVPDEVATARAAFNAAKKKGMLAYAVDPETGGRTGEVIREFDETKGKIIMVRQTQGG